MPCGFHDPCARSKRSRAHDKKSTPSSAGCCRRNTSRTVLDIVGATARLAGVCPPPARRAGRPPLGRAYTETSVGCGCCATKTDEKSSVFTNAAPGRSDRPRRLQAEAGATLARRRESRRGRHGFSCERGNREQFATHDGTVRHELDPYENQENKREIGDRLGSALSTECCNWPCVGCG